DAALQQAWTAVDVGAPWFSRHELARTRGMLESFTQWWRLSRSELTEVAVEVGVDVVLDAGTDEETGQPLTVQVRGRIDRLERDVLGRLVVVDVKTSKNPISADAAQEHAQLATYQVAAEEGGVVGHDAGGPSGGARLVYVAKSNRKTGATQREQQPLDGDATARWRAEVVDAAGATRGPYYVAKVNDGCTHCPVRGACPAHDSGRQVGGT
ncbi:MAG: PD-(D/E)XK nuclease family protein, partial [Mycobacteriaceae bacterium]